MPETRMLGRVKDEKAQFDIDYDACMIRLIHIIEERYQARDRQRYYIDQIRAHMNRYLKPKF